MAENARPGHNSFDPELAKNFVKRIVSKYDDIGTLRGEYMAACKVVKEDIKTIFEDADDKGIPLKSLKAAIKALELTRKAEAQRAGLNDIDLIDKFDQILHSLGDLASTPLGMSALGRAA